MRRFCLLAAVATLAVACSAAETTSPSSSDVERDSIGETTWSIVDAENRRDGQAPALHAALEDASSAVRERALLAYGRIGGVEVVPILAPFLASSTASTRARAAYALSVAGSEATHPEVVGPARSAILARLPLEDDATVRAALLVALSFVGDASVLSVFEDAVAHEAEGLARSGAVNGLGTYFSKQRTVTPTQETWAALVAMATATTDATEDAARALSYFPGAEESAVASLVALANAKVAANDVPTAGWLVRAVGAIKSPSSEAALLATLEGASTPDRVAAYAAEALAKQAVSPTTLAGFRAALGHASTKVAHAALTGLPALAKDAAPLVPELTGLVQKDHAHPDLAAGALTALAAIDPAAAKPLTAAALAPATSDLLHETAIWAMATTDAAALVPICQGADLHFAVIALDSLTGLPLEQLHAAFGPNASTDVVQPLLEKAIARHDEYSILVVASIMNEVGLPGLLDSVVAELPRYARPESMAVRSAIIHAISTANAKSHLPVLQALLHDPTRAVSLDAAEAIKKMTNEDVAAQVTAHNAPSYATPSREEIDAALQARVVFETPRGKITFKMLPDAPLMATKFVEVTRGGAFNANPFHRIVSNWVAQGGAPRDGVGHRDFMVQDEPSPNGHGFGYVGLATAGKDTGSSQYFIDLASNHRLDTVYSSFAVVESGMDAALAIEQGDLVTSASVVTDSSR